MNIDLKEREIKNFIHKYGVDKYENCPCGSGKKYKWCCNEKANPCTNENELKELYHKLKSEIWNRRTWKKSRCHWYGCQEETQRCHSIQNNRFLNQIYGSNKEVYHFIPMGTIENEKIELKEETVSFASTFNGFCNTHDRELFAVIEGNNQMTYSIEQKYALVYRNFYYMLCKKEVAQQTITRMSLRRTPQYYCKNFKFKTSEDAQTAVDLILALRKNQILYQELAETISEIELNYDQLNHTWNSQKHSLVFGQVRIIRVDKSKFCFQTVKEYLSRDEVEQMSHNSTINNFENKRYNYISTIILPDVQTSQITVFFAISAKHSTNAPCIMKTIVNTKFSFDFLFTIIYLDAVD